MASSLCIVRPDDTCWFVHLFPGDRVFAVQAEGYPLIPPPLLFEAPGYIRLLKQRAAAAAAVPPPPTPDPVPPPPAAEKPIRSTALERQDRVAAAEAQILQRRLRDAFMNLRRAAHFAAQARHEHEARVQAFRERRALRIIAGFRARARSTRRAEAQKNLLAIRFRAWKDAARRRALQTVVLERQVAKERAFKAWNTALRINRTRRIFHAFRAAVNEQRAERLRQKEMHRINAAVAIVQARRRIGNNLLPVVFLYCVSRFHLRCLWEDLVQFVAGLPERSAAQSHWAVGVCSDMVAISNWRQPPHHGGAMPPNSFQYALRRIIDAISDAALELPRFGSSDESFEDEAKVFVQIPITMAQSFALMCTSMENVYSDLVRECGDQAGHATARRLIDHYSVPVHTACTREHFLSAEFVSEAEVHPSMQNMLPYAMKAMMDMQSILRTSCTAEAHAHCLQAFCAKQGSKTVPPSSFLRPEICLRVRPVSRTPDQPAEPNVPVWMRTVFCLASENGAPKQAPQKKEDPRISIRRKLTALRQARK